MVEEDSGPERSSPVSDSQEPTAGQEELRILFIVPFAPRRDVRHGGRVVAQLLYRMAQRHRVAVVYLVVDGEGELMETELAGACELVVPVPQRRPSSRWRERFA